MVRSSVSPRAGTRTGRGSAGPDDGRRGPDPPPMLMLTATTGPSSVVGKDSRMLGNATFDDRGVEEGEEGAGSGDGQDPAVRHRPSVAGAPPAAIVSHPRSGRRGPCGALCGTRSARDKGRRPIRPARSTRTGPTWSQLATSRRPDAR
jgi:hypothetical protein